MSDSRLKVVRRFPRSSSRTSFLIAVAAVAGMATPAVFAQAKPAVADATLLPLCTPGIAADMDTKAGLGLYEVGRGLLAADLVDEFGAKNCLKGTAGNLSLNVGGVHLNLTGTVQYQSLSGPQRRIVASSPSPALCESYYTANDQFALKLANANNEDQGTGGLLGGVLSLSYSLSSGAITPLLSQAAYGPWVACHDATTPNATLAADSADVVFRASFENNADLLVEYLDADGDPVDTLLQTVNADIVYKARVTNRGEAAAQNVRIREFVPKSTGLMTPSMSMVSCVRDADSQPCQLANSPLSQDVATMAPGQSLTYTLTRRVAGTAALPAENGALTSVAAFVDPSLVHEAVNADNRRRLQIGLIEMVAVTASIRTNGVAGGSGGSIAPNGTTNYTPGSSGHAYTATVAPNHQFVNFTGTCPGTAAANVFTTGAINANCTVIANFSIDTFQVSLDVAQNGHQTRGSITPNGNQTINHGSTATYTIAPQTGYQAAVSGCGGAAQSGLTASTPYVTAAITAACSVSVAFTPLQYSVTSSIIPNGVDGQNHGTITPASQLIDHGTPATFTVTPDSGYSVALSGCGGLTNNGNGTYSTAAVTGACNVTASFSQNQYVVSASSSGNGSITPPSQNVNHGQSATFNVTPATNYRVSGFSGSCPTPVPVTGSTYVSLGISASCTVIANFELITHAVTAGSLTNGAINVNNSPVTHGQNALFTVQPDTGYHLVGNVTGTSACGTVAVVSGNDWSAGPIEADGCVLSATFAINVYDVTVSMTGSNGTIGDPAGTDPVAQTVNHGGNLSVRATPAVGYHAVFDTTSGSCDFTDANLDGLWEASNITADCDANVTFVLNTYTVTASVTGDTAGSSVSPVSQAGVGHGSFHFVNITIAAGHHLVTPVSHTCAGGSLQGGGTPGDPGDPASYRVLVTANCSITATIAVD
jgi:uncharacterized repeat protein (TIGR01451 family)